jgi:predicted transcriptional regulator
MEGTFSIMSGVYKIYRHDSQPFAQVPNSAIRDPEISPNAFRLLAYLMSHKEGYELTYGQIERQTTLGRYAINEAIKILTNKGWLKTERTKKDNGQFGPTSFHIMDPDAVDSIADDSSAGDSTMEQPTDIKNTNYLEKTKDKEKHLKAFDDFWELYPKKVAKADALRAWTKAIKRKSPDELVKLTKVYSEGKLPDMTYIPYPASWLNKELYDSVEEPKEKTLAKPIFGRIK